MGTRSLTHVYDDEGTAILATIYRQFDGYPEGHGTELIRYFADTRLTNGLGRNRSNRRDKVFNGMGDVAVRLITHLKVCGRRKGQSMDWAGNYYLETPGARDMGEEYIYHVKPCDGAIEITIERVY